MYNTAPAPPSLPGVTGPTTDGMCAKLDTAGSTISLSVAACSF